MIIISMIKHLGHIKQLLRVQLCLNGNDMMNMVRSIPLAL